MNKKTRNILATIFIPVIMTAIGYNLPEKERSSQWAKIRTSHLEKHPECAVCGQKDDLNVHHIKPFHINPELELDPENLITLCVDGPFHLNCHGLIGHCGNYKCYNPNVVEDAKKLREILNRKICE